MKNKESGFSLFELMVVIAMIAILSTIVIPNFMTWRSNANLRGSVFNLKSDLEMAKMRAIRSGDSVAIVFTGSTYEIFQDTDGDFLKDNGETLILDRKFIDLSVSPDLGGTYSTSFNNKGLVSKTGSITLSNNDHSIVISINKIGLISM